MPTPHTYYEMLPQRLLDLGVNQIEEDIGTLRDLEILVDGSHPRQYLLQIFMKEASQIFNDRKAGPLFHRAACSARASAASAPEISGRCSRASSASSRRTGGCRTAGPATVSATARSRSQAFPGSAAVRRSGRRTALRAAVTSRPEYPAPSSGCKLAAPAPTSMAPFAEVSVDITRRDRRSPPPWTSASSTTWFRSSPPSSTS